MNGQHEITHEMADKIAKWLAECYTKYVLPEGQVLVVEGCLAEELVPEGTAPAAL